LQLAAATNTNDVIRRTGRGTSALHPTQQNFEPKPRLYRRQFLMSPEAEVEWEWIMTGEPPERR
jgi:hypothetical protein